MPAVTNNEALRSLSDISAAAQALIDKFENALSSNLKQQRFISPYRSIDDILIRKYHLSSLDKIDFPDLTGKTEFITHSIRGNLSKAEGKILTYEEANDIVDKALTEALP